MKKKYSAPAITVYGVETASMLMGSTEVYQNNVSGLDDSKGGSVGLSIDPNAVEEDAGGAW